jgi:hypothetical protein
MFAGYVRTNNVGLFVGRLFSDPLPNHPVDSEIAGRPKGYLEILAKMRRELSPFGIFFEWADLKGTERETKLVRSYRTGEDVLCCCGLAEVP